MALTDPPPTPLSSASPPPHNSSFGEGWKGVGCECAEEAVAAGRGRGSRWTCRVTSVQLAGLALTGRAEHRYTSAVLDVIVLPLVVFEFPATSGVKLNCQKYSCEGRAVRHPAGAPGLAHVGAAHSGHRQQQDRRQVNRTVCPYDSLSGSSCFVVVTHA